LIHMLSSLPTRRSSDLSQVLSIPHLSLFHLPVPALHLEDDVLQSVVGVQRIGNNLPHRCGRPAYCCNSTRLGSMRTSRNSSGVLDRKSTRLNSSHVKIS